MLRCGTTLNAIKIFPRYTQVDLLSNILSVNYQIDGLEIYLWCSKISHTANGRFPTQD